MKKLFILITVFSLTACLEQETGSSTGTSTNGDTGGISGTTGNNGGGTTGSTTGTDGSSGTNGGGSFPYHTLDLLLSGHQSWVPGNYTDNLAQETQITVQEAKLLFASDSRLRVRFKINQQPFPTAGEKLCFDRTTGQAADQYPYTKLKFRVRLRDILCDNPDPNNTNNCLSGFYLGGAYAAHYVGPVNVDGYSEILDLGDDRNVSVYGTTVEVDQVYSDNYCQATGQYCPANFTVRQASCWHMTMEVVTDYTSDF
jgi:hypothetical protein